METKEFKQLLARAEDGDAGAMLLVGLAYESGDGTEADIKEALAWMISAAELGNRDAKAWLDDYYFDDDAGVQSHS